MIIAVDYDGTIATEEYPFAGKPNWDIINFIKYKKRNGDIIILHTCRSGQALKEAVAACDEWGLEFDFINENTPERIKQFGADTRKISADVYLDNLALNVHELELLLRNTIL